VGECGRAKCSTNERTVSCRRGCRERSGEYMAGEEVDGRQSRRVVMSELATASARMSPREVAGGGDGKPRRNVSGMDLDIAALVAEGKAGEDAKKAWHMYELSSQTVGTGSVRGSMRAPEGHLVPQHDAFGKSRG
jgi:hypothetical protein